MNKTIYIGLPCYNEEQDINTLIDRILKIKNKIKKEFNYNIEIFCVNDGSTDDTEKIIKNRKKDNIKLINHEKNKGLGEAMKTILNYFRKTASKNDFLIVMDADNSHNPKYIINLIKKQEKENKDVIIASRYQEGAKITGLKKYREFMSNMAKLWYNMMLKIPNVRDYTCGYRLYTYKSIDNAYKKYEDNIITQSSFACMMELLYKLHLTGSQIDEIPFKLEYDKKVGKSKMKVLKTSISSLKTTIQIKNNNFNIKNTIPYIIILLLSIILLFMSCSRLKNVGLIWDPAVYLNVARNILNGKILYKDIVDNKGPILYFINALGLKIGGQTGVCIIEFLSIFLSFIFMYKSLKLIDNNKKENLLILFVAFSTFGSCFTYGLTCEGYGLTFSMIGLYLCLKYYNNNKFNYFQCLILGILCALTFFIRPNMISVFAGFGIGIGLELIIYKRLKELIKYIIFALIGFIIITIPILIYLLNNNCFNDFIYNVFILNLTMNKYGFLPSIYKFFINIPLTLIIIFTYLYLLIDNTIKEKNINNLGIIICIILTITFNCVSAGVCKHYIISLLPIIILSHKYFIYSVNNKKIPILILSIIATSNIFLFIPNFKLTQPNTETIKYIKENTNNKDQIAVIGFHDEIYYLSKRESASKYTYILEGKTFSKENQTKWVENYLKDIIDNKPKIIVEDVNALEKGIEPYINIDNYNYLKENYYTYIDNRDKLNIYKLK